MYNSPVMVLESTKRKLAALSNNLCAFTGCDEIVYDREKDSFLAQTAHIRGKRKRSPRYDPEYTGDLDSIENIILLCTKHHKIIDDHPEKYTIEKLTRMKEAHETSSSNYVPIVYYEAIDYMINKSGQFSQDIDATVKHINVLMEEASKPVPNKANAIISWNYVKRKAPYAVINMLKKHVEPIVE
jgi:hypothetical protein